MVPENKLTMDTEIPYNDDCDRALVDCIVYNLIETHVFYFLNVALTMHKLKI